MTSRVQKGSQIFRPTKGKARPPPRPSQASSSSQHSHPSLASSSNPHVPLVTSSTENELDTSISVSRPASPPSELPLFLESRQSSPNPGLWDSDPPTLDPPSTLVESTPPPPHPTTSSSTATIVAEPDSDSDSDDLQTTPKATTRQSSRVKSVSVEEGESSDSRSSASEYEEEGQRPKKKRKRLTISEDPEPDPNPNPSKPKTKRRISSTGPTAKKRKRKTSPAPPPFDSSADPGEELDPTALTMAMLCDDPGQGRVSSKALEIINNHTEWKVRSKAKRAEMKAKAERKKYGRPEEEPEQGSEATEPTTPAVVLPDPASPSPTGTSQQDGDDIDYTQGLQHSRFNAQIRIGPNGETIVDETSLVVEREDGEASTEGYAHVVESDLTKFTNSGTFAKKTKGSRWSAEETELFYDALQQFGENYELMSMILPGRDRKSIQNKFKSEDKKNTARINHSLKHSRPIDMATLTRLTGKDFSGPVPVIKIPTPPPPPPPPEPTSEGGETDGHSNSTSQKINKRSRSRSKQRGTLGDGVEIVGTADTFDPGFAEE